jgi:hypothetical protein
MQARCLVHSQVFGRRSASRQCPSVQKWGPDPSRAQIRDAGVMGVSMCGLRESDTRHPLQNRSSGNRQFAAVHNALYRNTAFCASEKTSNTG